MFWSTLTYKTTYSKILNAVLVLFDLFLLESPPLLIRVVIAFRELRSFPVMKTLMAKPGLVEQKWLLIDASGKTLGNLATKIAHILRGKHKPEFTPHVDTGDYIVVINAEKVTVTGTKAKNKLYERYTGYPGGLKSISFEKLQKAFPARIIEKAVKGMLPKNPLGYAMITKLKVYAGSAHPHSAQNPEPTSIDRL
ncbi:MAG: ribosomal protein [Pseudomonadota bacterium]